ncbi:hypothetical protein WJX84_006032 [Apatococcus fuscideae]|uniref:Uncharacterized protein n=1 Tax=Apatococcus fuscideae TaxID=2026836 RepID=A0AAW1T402_9CHLO
MQGFPQRNWSQQDPWELEAFSLLVGGGLQPGAPVSQEASRPLQCQLADATRIARGLPLDPAVPTLPSSSFPADFLQRHRLLSDAQEAVTAAFERADALNHALHDRDEVHARKQSQQLPTADVPMAHLAPHLSSRREMEMGAVVAGLQQPMDLSSANQADPVASLQELNQMRSLQGVPLVGAADRMRIANLQGLNVQPGWHEVVPCNSTILQVYAALERGHLDMPVHLTTGQNGTFTSLRQLTAVPLQQQLDMFRDASSKIVNAMHLKLSSGDMCDQAVMKLAGESSFMGCVFFQPCGSLHVHGTDYHNGRSQPGIGIAPSQLKKALRLDTQQVRIARQAWKATSEALVELEAKRGDILSQIFQNDAANRGWQGSHLHEASKTAKLLDKVAELSENAQVQQELLRHGVRVLIWQICSPATLARLVCCAWPAFPDLIATLQTIASVD